MRKLLNRFFDWIVMFEFKTKEGRKMTDVFSCTEDNSAPDEIKEAGKKGRLQVNSVIGWIDIEMYMGVSNGCEYRIKPREEGFYWVDFDGGRNIALWDGSYWSVGGMHINPKNINEKEITE